MSDYVLCNGDCLEELKNVPDKSVQLILTDLPYGTVKNTTACKWDDVIPMEKLWPEFERIDKELEKQNGIRNESENNEGAAGTSDVGLSTI